MFDDHCCQLTGGGTYVDATGPSRGLVLKLDQRARTATLVAQYPGDGDFESEYMGDTQPLSNGNVFVGWGSNRTSPSTADRVSCCSKGELPGPNLTYRATLERWVGLPLSSPTGAAAPDGRQDDGVRELERRHPARLLEGPGRDERRSAERRGEATPSPGSRRRSQCHRELRELQGPGARRETAA